MTSDWEIFSNDGRSELPGKTTEFRRMADYTISYEKYCARNGRSGKGLKIGQSRSAKLI